MKDKVEIVITEGHNYVDSVKGGMSFTSVDYNGRLYGGCSPCDTEEEVQNAIKNMKETIYRQGDTPIVVDKREKATLLNWMR